jgi:uncharacterized membrane protein
MASGQAPQDAIQPLTVGNVVSAGIRLYRSHLGQYLGIAIRATLWILLPFLGFSLAFYLAREQAVAIALLILAAIVAYFFCTAKFLTNSAVISRLAFSELVNQPESVKQARAPVDRRLWRFLGAACLLSLISFGVWLASSMVNQTILVAVTYALGGTPGGPSPDNLVAGVVIGLTLFILQIIFLTVQFWVTARFFIYDTPLAVENDVGAAGTISRSWELTKGNAWRIFLITLVTFLVTVPFYILILLVLISFAIPLFRGYVSPLDLLPVLFPLILGSIILFLLVSMLVMPLWQAIKAVVYYDLRTRREGFGLQIRDRDI